jgi:hypothetical protein
MSGEEAWEMKCAEQDEARDNAAFFGTSEDDGWKPERLESTQDFWEFYQHLQKTARTMLKEIDPHDHMDYRLVELTDLCSDANSMMRMLCKRTQSLIVRLEKVSNRADIWKISMDCDIE